MSEEKKELLQALYGVPGFNSQRRWDDWTEFSDQDSVLSAFLDNWKTASRPEWLGFAEVGLATAKSEEFRAITPEAVAAAIERYLGSEVIRQQ